MFFNTNRIIIHQSEYLLIFSTGIHTGINSGSTVHGVCSIGVRRVVHVLCIFLYFWRYALAAGWLDEVSRQHDLLGTQSYKKRRTQENPENEKQDSAQASASEHSVDNNILRLNNATYIES